MNDLPKKNNKNFVTYVSYNFAIEHDKKDGSDIDSITLLTALMEASSNHFIKDKLLSNTTFYITEDIKTKELTEQVDNSL